MSRIATILAMVLLLSPVAGFPARAAEVNLDPADPVVAVGDTFSVSITVSLDPVADEQLAGGVIDLGYDDGVVEIIAVAIAPYWDFEPDPGSKSGPGLWEDIGFDAFVNDPVTENTLIASVTLEALSAGTSQLAVLTSSEFFSAAAEFFPTLNGASIRVNTPPVADDLVVGTDEDTGVPFTLTGSDDDGDDLTYAVVDGPASGTLSGTAPNLTYTPSDNFNGSDSFTYRVNDGAADSDTATVSITVTAVNDPPTADDRSVTIGEDVEVTVALTGSDVDGDDLTFSLVAGPANGTLSGTAPNLTYAPDANFSGSDGFTFQVSDGSLLSNPGTVTITVYAVNDAPTISGTPSTSVWQDAFYSFSPSADDVDSNELTFSIFNRPDWADFDPVNGVLSGTPGNMDVGLTAGIIVSVSDGESTVSLPAFSIEVLNVNDAPDLEPIGPRSTAEGETVAITLEAFDPDDDDLTFIAADLPPGARFAPEERAFSWAPYFNSSGNYRVLFRVTDDGTPPMGAYEYVTITVGDVNRPPVLAPIGPRHTAEGDTLSFNISASDPEGDYLSFDAEDVPPGANFDNLSGTFTWQTQIGDAGNYTINFSVMDDGIPPESDSERITISVGDVNRPPVMDPVGDHSIIEGGILVITLTATDPEAGTLFFQCDEMPDGAALDQDYQVFSWTTLSGDAGSYPLTCTVTDAGSPPESDTVSAVITVLRDPATNRAPEADAGPDQAVYEGDTVTLNGSNSLDPDAGDTLTYFWEQIEGDPVDWIEFSGAVASLTAPDINSDGQTLIFRLTITDLLGLWDEDECIVNVTRANRPPEADAGDDQVVREDRDTPIILDGSGSSDPDAGDTLTFFWEQINGEAIVMTGIDQATASFIAPDVGVGGQAFEFRLTVTDSGNLRAEDTCIVNVTWVNEPPSVDAGDNQTAEEGTTVILDGSGSFDPDDGIASWRWRQTDTSGHPVTLSDPTAEMTTFVAPAVDAETVLSFELAVADTYGLADTGDPVPVTVFDNGITDFGAGITCTTFLCGQPFGLECGQGAYLTLLSLYESYEDYVIPGGLFTLDTRYGAIEMEFRLDSPGTAATVTLYLTDPLPAEISWHQYDPDSGWIPTDASLSSSIAKGTMLNADRTVMTLTLTDNGQYDQDPTAGVLKTIGGFGTSSAAVSNEESPGGGGGGGGSGCFIDTITSR